MEQAEHEAALPPLISYRAKPKPSDRLSKILANIAGRSKH